MFNISCRPWSLIALLLAVFFSLFTPAVFAAPPTAKDVETYFARYLVGGRSDVEVHFNVAVEDSSAEGEHNDNGSYTSFVTVYEVPKRLKVKEEQMEMAKRWVFIHEHTHALILPYVDVVKPRKSASIEEWVAFRLKQQAHESTSDARALLLIWKKDGSDTALSQAQVWLEFRNGDGAGHQTQLAITKTIDVLTNNPASVRTDEDALRVILAIAKESAFATGARLLAQNDGVADAEKILSSEAVRKAKADIERGFGLVMNAYVSGRFQNNAATIRFANNAERATQADYHFYVGSDGEITRDAVLGGEGARGKNDIIALMTNSGTPERFFAIETVKKLGRTTAEQLNDTVVIYERFVRVFGGDSPARRARAYGIIAQVILATDSRAPLSSVYTEVNRRMMFEIGFPK